MMGYELQDDEVAIIIRPRDYEEDWGGDVAINLVSSKDSPVPIVVMAQVINIATMMSAFIDIASDNPDLYDLVEEHRNYLLGFDPQEEKEDDSGEELEVIRTGNVYTLSKWSKTEGNA